MATVLSQLPANYLSHLLNEGPDQSSFQIGGLVYSRSQILASFQLVADESNVVCVGLHINNSKSTVVPAKSRVSKVSEIK